MIFRLLSTRKFGLWLFLIFCAFIIFYIQIFSRLEYVSVESEMVLSQLFNNIFFNNKYIISTIVFIVYIFSGVMLERINNRYILLPQTYLHVVLFFFFSFPFLQISFFPVLIANFFIILSCFFLFKATSPQKFEGFYIYDAGLFIGMASLFYFNSIYLLFFLFVSLIILNLLDFRYFIPILLLGFITPWIFVFSYYILNGHLMELIDTIAIQILPKNLFSFDYSVYTLYRLLLFLILIFITVNLFVVSSKLKISTRKISYIFFALILNTILIIVYEKFLSCLIILMMIFPLSFLLSQRIFRYKNMVLKNLILFLVSALVLITLISQNIRLY